jgi:hypothetical protein
MGAATLLRSGTPGDTVMPMQHPSHEFDADDRKVYRDWMRNTVVVYVALVLCCVAVVTLQMMTHPAEKAFSQKLSIEWRCRPELVISVASLS